MPATRVLVFNFFAGVKDRGIPQYARELEECLARGDIESIELRCPAWARGLPQGALNLLFVLFEQIVAPLMRWRKGCIATIYPYNSAGLWDAWRGRGLLVIHDFISNKRSNRKLAARYIRWTQAWHCRWRQPICAVSDHTQKHLLRVAPYRACPVYLCSNPFYAFQHALERLTSVPRLPASETRRTLLLCTGLGPNKDFRGALALFRDTPEMTGWQLRIVGFGNDTHLANRLVRKLSKEVRDRIVVLPRLDMSELVEEYLRCDVVWAHSLKEGFGRSLVEARMSGKPVLARSITAFRRLAFLKHVTLYRNEQIGPRFQALLKAGINVPAASPEVFHQQLESQMRDALAHCGLAATADTSGVSASKLPRETQPIVVPLVAPGSRAAAGSHASDGAPATPIKTQRPTTPRRTGDGSVDSQFGRLH